MIALEFTGRTPDHRMLRAGFEAEKQLAFYLDRAFRDEAFVRVFHGLRLERGSDVAQIDHLVLHRFGFVLVESKSIVDSVIINEFGEFTRTYRGRAQGMPSPIAQVQRQADLLRLLLNDHKTKLRRVVGVGPFKQQGEFGEQRFMLIAAISDKGQIKCAGERPEEVMKAEAVVQKIQDRIAYQESLHGAGGFARSLVAEFTDRKKAREWEQDSVPAYTDDELDAITEFLVSSHRPRGGAVEQVKDAAEEVRPARPAAQVASHAAPKSRRIEPSTATSRKAKVGAKANGKKTARKGPARNMAKWSSEEEDRLRQAFAAGRTAEDLATEFGRTPKALRLRAQKLGLIDDVAAWK